MMKSRAALALAVALPFTAVAAPASASSPRTVVCYQSAPGEGCAGRVNVSPPQRLDMILADGHGTAYWGAEAECDQAGGRLDSYKVRPRHGRVFIRYICRGVDY